MNTDEKVILITTKQELADLFHEILGKEQSVVIDNSPKEKRLLYGIAGIAQLFNCSMTMANRIKASGKIDKAISQYGRKIIIDADLALELIKKE